MLKTEISCFCGKENNKNVYLFIDILAFFFFCWFCIYFQDNCGMASGQILGFIILETQIYRINRKYMFGRPDHIAY